MRNPRTTIFGMLAAAAGAIAALPDITGQWHTVALVIAAAATACLGFFAADDPGRNLPRAALLAVFGALAIVAVCSACSVAGFKASAVIPTIGDYTVAIGGGSIGNRPATNYPPIATTNTP